MRKALSSLAAVWPWLAALLVVRWLHPEEDWRCLDYLALGWAIVCGTVTGVLATGYAWRLVHEQQEECLRRASSFVQEELRLLGYYDIEHPFREQAKDTDGTERPLFHRPDTERTHL